MFLCACVSVVVTPPLTTLPLIALPLAFFFSSLLTSSTLLCLSCSALTLGSQWRTPAPPLQRWRESSPTAHTHTHTRSHTHSHTMQLQCTMEIIQGSCRPCCAGKWSLSSPCVVVVVQANEGELGEAGRVLLLTKQKVRCIVCESFYCNFGDPVHAGRLCVQSPSRL